MDRLSGMNCPMVGAAGEILFLVAYTEQGAKRNASYAINKSDGLFGSDSEMI